MSRSNNRNQYNNTYKRWTAEEEVRLSEELKSKLSISEIANLHNRSINAISLRVDKIYKNIHQRMLDTVYKSISIKNPDALDIINDMMNKTINEKKQKIPNKITFDDIDENNLC